MEKSNKLTKRLQSLQKEAISVSKDLASTGARHVISEGLSYLVDGGISKIIGDLITNSAERAISSAVQKQLARREQGRIGFALEITVKKIVDNQNKKLTINNNFFNKEEERRSAADEIFEQTLLVSQKEHEEQKIEYYGNLLGNILFCKQIDKSRSNHLIKIANDLTYTQLLIISVLYKNSSKEPYRLKSKDYRNGVRIANETLFILSEIMELYHKGLILLPNDTLLGITCINPGKMEVQGVGNFLYSLMELNTLPKEELNTIIKLLS